MACAQCISQQQQQQHSLTSHNSINTALYGRIAGVYKFNYFTTCVMGPLERTSARQRSHSSCNVGREFSCGGWSTMLFVFGAYLFLCASSPLRRFLPSPHRFFAPRSRIHFECARVARRKTDYLLQCERSSARVVHLRFPVMNVFVECLGRLSLCSL